MSFLSQEKLASSLLMLNKIKTEITFPEFMEFCNIVSIYKGKGERMDLDSERGIFIVNIIRSILMKMVYQDKYETIDSSMSDSNVGARKKKGIRNHLFIEMELSMKLSGINQKILTYR